jgi:uncharacterized protein (TIGR03437 family)
MLSARTVNIIILTAILVFASAKASAQQTTIAWNSIPHPAAKLNTLIGHGSKLIAGNADGIFVSSDNGQTWVVQNNGLPSPLNITELVTVKNLIFANTDKGIWKSDDEAQSWSDFNTGLLATQTNKSIYAVGEKIFVGLIDDTSGSGKLLLSYDYGQNWKVVSAGLPDFSFFFPLCSVGNILFVGVIYSGTLYLFRSSDDGNSWKRCSNLTAGVYFGRVSIIKNSGMVLHAIGTYSDAVRSHAARWISSDLGDSWQLVEDHGSPFLVPSFTSLEASGNNVFFCYQQDSFFNRSDAYSSFNYSFDWGSTFSGSYLYFNQTIGSFGKIFLANDSVYLIRNEYSSYSLLQSDRKVLTPVATTVSAASYQQIPLASGSLASLFGNGLALTTAIAGSPLTSLENVSVLVNQTPAPLFYVSPTQINFQLPAGLVGSTGTVTVKLYNQIVASGMIAIANTSPGLFSVNQTGEGLAAATVQRVAANGIVTFDPIAQYNSSAQKFIPFPINVQSGTDQVYLNLYGTGIRGRSELTNVRATVDGIDVPVLYAGSQGSFLGVDQVNVLLPSSLAGKKEVNVILTVDNQVANPVKIFIQ